MDPLEVGPKLPPGSLPITLPTVSPNVLSWCNFQIDSFVEGPAGLLAHGSVVCQDEDCSNPKASRPYSATWASTDGLNWTVADGVPDGELAVGAAGYMVTEGQNVWTSADARTWQEGVAPKVALPNGSRWGHLVAIGNGFVMGPETGYALDPLSSCNFLAGSTTDIVWSADGRTWTRSNPPGGNSGSTETLIDNLSDGLLLLREESFSATGGYSWTAWTSSDGRAWHQLAAWKGISSLTLGSVQVHGVAAPNADVLTFGGHAILGHADQGQDMLYGFDAAAGRVIPLTNTGSADWPSISFVGHSVALGPAGLVVSDDQGGLIIAVPTAG